MITLSQIGLSIRLGKSTKWIRDQGELVTWLGETWAKMEYSNHRCAGYEQCGWNPKPRAHIKQSRET